MALVLIVDDDRDTRFVIRNLLLSRDYDVIEAKSGAQAFEILDSMRRSPLCSPMTCLAR